MSTKRPVDEGAVSRNANDVLMFRVKLKSLEERAVIANTSVLEAEKERDKLHKELELIDVQLQGKRARTHDDTGNGHDMHAEVDEWDLRDLGKDRGMTSESWQNQRSLSTSCTGRSTSTGKITSPMLVA